MKRARARTVSGDKISEFNVVDGDKRRQRRRRRNIRVGEEEDIDAGDLASQNDAMNSCGCLGNWAPRFSATMTGRRRCGALHYTSPPSEGGTRRRKRIRCLSRSCHRVCPKFVVTQKYPDYTCTSDGPRKYVSLKHEPDCRDNRNTELTAVTLSSSLGVYRRDRRARNGYRACFRLRPG